MAAGEIAVWLVALIVIMACTCWRLVGQHARRRRCSVAVRGMCVNSRGNTWIHGDSAEETQISQPVYRYEYEGKSYESAAGAATMLFEHSPAANKRGEFVELWVNPSNPAEVYDPAYEGWFAKYRVAWGAIAFVGLFAIVSLLNVIG